MSIVVPVVLFPILVVLFFLGCLKANKLFSKMWRQRVARRIAELANVQNRISEVESGLPLLQKNARSTENATDCGSEPWQVRTNNRIAEVKSDQTLLADLRAREKELIKLLNKEG